MPVTASLSTFAAALLPPDAELGASLLLLDLAGEAIRARHAAEYAPSMLAAARALGVAAGNCGVFGDSARYTPAGAAFLNAAFGCALGAAAPVVAAALAAGEATAASGRDVLSAIVAGYEVARRQDDAAPGAGVLGAAVAAGRVFRLDAAGMDSSLRIARASGAAAALVQGMAGFAAGWAAMGGLTAAVLAREGLHTGRGGAVDPATPQGIAPIPGGAREPDEARRAFMTRAAPVLGEAQADRLADAVLALGAAHGVMSLARLSAPAAGARLAGG